VSLRLTIRRPKGISPSGHAIATADAAAAIIGR